MSRKPASAPTRIKQTRLSPDERRKDFVRKATEFFADEGFNGGTRELARRLGVTQPLLYRYFPSKDDLIKEVYRNVYLKPLEGGWEKRLTDRSRPVRERLGEFYESYTDGILNRTWLRIFLFSGLKGLDIHRAYVSVIRDQILSRVIKECRAEAGLPAQAKPTASELETAWVFHSGIIYYGIRRYIYEWPVMDDKSRMIANALDVYLAGVNKAYADMQYFAKPSARSRIARRAAATA